MADDKTKGFLYSILGLGIVSTITGALLRKTKRATHFERPGASSGRVKVVDGIILGPNGFEYVITDTDKLWLGRALAGEVSPSHAQANRGMEAVLWSLVQNFVLVDRGSSRFSTLTALIRAYAQPCSAAWADPNSSKCQGNPSACTPDRIQRRREIQSKPWSRLSPAIQLTVNDFIEGFVANPVPEMVDYAAFTFNQDRVQIAGNYFGTQSFRRLV